MAVDVHLVRRPYGFTPRTAFDEEAIGIFPIGCEVKVSITRPKSDKHRRFYFALVGKLAKGMGIPAEGLSTELIARCGYIEMVQFINGEMHPVTMSIGKMDQPIFSAFVEAATDLIKREYLPGIEGQKAADEAWALLGVPGGYDR